MFHFFIDLVLKEPWTQCPGRNKIRLSKKPGLEPGYSSFYAQKAPGRCLVLELSMECQ